MEYYDEDSGIVLIEKQQALKDLFFVGNRDGERGYRGNTGETTRLKGEIINIKFLQEP